MRNKITFIMASPGGGGSESVGVNIANRLADRGWHVDFVCMNLKRKEYLETISKKVNLVNLNISRFALSFIPIMFYLKRNKVKNIVSFNYFYSIQLVLQKFLLGNQFKIIARNNISLSQDEKYDFSSNIFKRFIFMIVKFLYPKVDYCIAQCEEMRIDLIRNYSFKNNKIKVIFNPVNYKIENSYENKKIPKEKFILIVGRLSKQKRHDVAIKVFSKIKQKFPDFKLKISGQGQEENFLRQLTKKYGINNSVEFLGFQKDLIPLYKRAKLTLMTSRYEGFPNVLIESITLGTPVVSFNCSSGPSEIIQNEINGFLVDDGDENMLEKKIIKTLGIEWNSQIIHDSADNFKNKKVIAEYEEIFNKLVNSNKN